MSDLPTAAVQPLHPSEARHTMEELFGKDIHPHCHYDITRCYVAAAAANMGDPGSIGWRGDLADGVDRGSTAYYCPTGFMKVAVVVPDAPTPAAFQQRTQGWNVCYHGTKPESVVSILRSGLRGHEGCWLLTNERGVYLSPSLEYSAHPRYAGWVQACDCRGSLAYYQVVLQCRVNYAKIHSAQSETLTGRVTDISIDPHFTTNDALEWIIRTGKGEKYAGPSAVIVTGILVRRSTNPYAMAQADWWYIPHLVFWKSTPEFVHGQHRAAACCLEYEEREGMHTVKRTRGCRGKCLFCQSQKSLPAGRAK